MENCEKRAILTVSFGTSHADTCAKTIGAIEDAIRKQYPQYSFYRAWTSSFIRKKMKNSAGIHIFSVREALNQMIKDGITEVVVQPTHIVHGIENVQMVKEIESVQSSFEKMAVSLPLLSRKEDVECVADFLMDEWKTGENEFVVFVGHGTKQQSNSAYAALNEQIREKGISNMGVGVLKGLPTIEDIIAVAEKTNARKIVLVPFMIVAGDHAKNDMSGEEEDSWKSVFEKEGYEVRCVLKGLGEYDRIRRMFLAHLAKTMDGMN